MPATDAQNCPDKTITTIVYMECDTDLGMSDLEVDATKTNTLTTCSN